MAELKMKDDVLTIRGLAAICAADKPDDWKEPRCVDLELEYAGQSWRLFVVTPSEREYSVYEYLRTPTGESLTAESGDLTTGTIEGGACAGILSVLWYALRPDNADGPLEPRGE